MESHAIQKRNLLSRIVTFTWLTKATLIETIAFLFIILFLYTGISKLMEYGVFSEQMADSPILKPFAPFMAWFLPLTELAVSVLLIIPRWRLKGFYIATALMAAFTIYIIGIMIFNKELPCSCGGIISLLSWKGHLVFNSAFILLGVAGIVMERQVRRNLKTQLNHFIAG